MLNPERSRVLVELLTVRGENGLSTSATQFANLVRSVHAGTSRLIKDEAGRAKGYITWASINKESATRLFRTGALPSHPFEWNEGNLILFTDIVFPKFRRKLFLNLVTRTFPGRRLFIYRKKNVVSVYRRSGVRLHLSVNYIVPKHFLTR